MTTVGVLGIQGDFAEHLAMLRRIGVQALDVRKAEQFDQIDGLIIPGGESTTISRVMRALGIFDALRAFAMTKPTWGTCAGAIMLATQVEGQEAHLRVMDMTIARNAFGRQIDSFSADLQVAGLRGGPLHAVFIRAPVIQSVGPEVKVLARLEDGRIVAAQQGHLLATSFHPELTPDLRMHKYFLDMIYKPIYVA